MIWKNLLSSLIFLVLLISSITIVSATRISPGKVFIDFEPNSVHTFEFFAGGVPNIGLVGSAAYGIDVEITNIRPGDGDNKLFTVTITLPDSVPIYGDKITVGGITATEITGEGKSGISTITAVSAPIFLKVPYPGLFIDASFSVNNININETAVFHVIANNKGIIDVDRLYATVDIYQYDGTKFSDKIKTFISEPRQILSKKSEDFIFKQNTTGWVPGEYKAVATVYYNENKTTIDRFFNIGSLNVIISNHTKQVTADTINRFDIEVESKWNSLIQDIYGEVTINGTTFKTPSSTLEPWKKSTLTGYWDTIGVSPKDYDALIQVFYQGSTNTKQGIVTVLPSEKKSPLLNTTTILIITIILLVLIDIFFIIRRKKKEEEEKNIKKKK